MNKFEITFLGTCACDFSPRLETDLKDKFDKDARRSSSVLLDGKYLIDCGIHTLKCLEIQGVNKDEITDIFITHTHDDHYDEKNINSLACGRKEPLRVWLREGASPTGLENVEIKYMSLFEKYDLGEISITGLVANHDKEASPQHFLIEKSDSSLFYGCDGAWLINDTYYHLKDKHLDVAVLDCTVGDYIGDYRLAEHNSIPMIRLMLPSLKCIGAIDKNTKIYLSHIAPSLHKSHNETVEIAKELGAYVAYDGLTIRRNDEGCNCN